MKTLYALFISPALYMLRSLPISFFVIWPPEKHWVSSTGHCTLHFVACLAVPHFFHIILQTAQFIEKVIVHKMCVLNFSTAVCQTSVILRGIKRDMNKSVYWLWCTVPLLLSDFSETWIFSTDFRKNTQISNFMKILPLGAEMFHADGRTDGHD